MLMSAFMSFQNAVLYTHPTVQPYQNTKKAKNTQQPKKKKRLNPFSQNCPLLYLLDINREFCASLLEMKNLVKTAIFLLK